MNVKFLVSTIMILFCIQIIEAQELNPKKDQGIIPFVGYELGEAMFNAFQSISAEVGIRFPNDHMFRLTHMNVNLTEGHLSSGFAGAVDGNNVEGKFFGFEAFYDFPLFFEGFYLSPSVGYYKNKYEHLLLDESLRNNSATLGLGVSYREQNVFGLKGLYYMVSLPMRTPLNPIEETKLGETTINNNQFDNNIWLFIGYEF